MLLQEVVLDFGKNKQNPVSVTAQLLSPGQWAVSVGIRPFPLFDVFLWVVWSSFKWLIKNNTGQSYPVTARKSEDLSFETTQSHEVK